MDTGTELTIPQRAAVALKADVRRQQFIDLAGASREIVAITNHDSYRECHAARMRLAKARIEVTKEGKQVRDDAVKFSKGVISLENELIALIQPEETRLQAIQDAHDERVQAAKDAAAKAEADRIAAEEQARRDAAEARIAAERAELEAQQAELLRRQQEQAEAEREATERIEAAERESQARIAEQERQAQAKIDEADRQAREASDAQARAERAERLKKAEEDMADHRERQRLLDEQAEQPASIEITPRPTTQTVHVLGEWPAAGDDPVLPCELVVGAVHLHKGIKVSSAQGAIDRLHAECRRLQEKYEPLTDEQVAFAKSINPNYDAAGGDATPEVECIIDLHSKPYWKDNNYYCSLCKQGMGHAYKHIRQKLERELAATSQARDQWQAQYEEAHTELVALKAAQPEQRG